MNRIISLDYNSNQLSVYNLNCKLQHHIEPKLQGSSLILGFAWQDQQQRIGITLKDYKICFADFIDNFGYWKIINTIPLLPEYQTRIWYLEIHDIWVTTDATNYLNCWDI